MGQIQRASANVIDQNTFTGRNLGPIAPMMLAGVNKITAIPAYAPKVLGDSGSEPLSERFDHPVVSFDVRFVIGHDRLSCRTQTSVVIEA